MTVRIERVWLLLAVSAALALSASGCDQESALVVDEGELWSVEEPWRCQVTPRRARDAVRVRFSRFEGGGGVENRRGAGVLEAGSRAAFNLVRMLNAVAAGRHRGDALPPEVLRKLQRAVWGRDGVPWTDDDRPIVSLADLSRRLSPDVDQWGLLIRALRGLPEALALPEETSAWRLIEGLAIREDEASLMLQRLRRCRAESLGPGLGASLRRHLESSPASLKALSQLPRFSREHAARLLYALYEACEPRTR